MKPCCHSDQTFQVTFQMTYRKLELSDYVSASARQASESDAGTLYLGLRDGFFQNPFAISLEVL
jgi:hypothetical protein